MMAMATPIAPQVLAPAEKLARLRLARSENVGPITFRGLDHQSTMGTWVGRTAVVDGKPQMVDWYYAEAEAYFPPDEEIKTLRSGE